MDVEDDVGKAEEGAQLMDIGARPSASFALVSVSLVSELDSAADGVRISMELCLVQRDWRPGS